MDLQNVCTLLQHYTERHNQSRGLSATDTVKITILNKQCAIVVTGQFISHCEAGVWP
jgi:hypothetical protein